MPPLGMWGGIHPTPCVTLTTTRRPKQHASGRLLQQKNMVHGTQLRDHLSPLRRDHNNQTPSGLHTRKNQRALDVGQRRHSPPHGACQHRHNPPCGQVEHRRDSILPPHDRTNVHSRACGAYDPTWGLCAYPPLPQGLKPPSSNSGPLIGLVWVTVGGLE